MGGCAGNKQPKPEEKDKPSAKQPEPLSKSPDHAAPAPPQKLTQSEYSIPHLESKPSDPRSDRNSTKESPNLQRSACRNSD